VSRTIDLTNIHWVIVGGESGPGARPMKIDWIREIFGPAANMMFRFSSSIGAAFARI
jgi:protein gp37